METLQATRKSSGLFYIREAPDPSLYRSASKVTAFNKDIELLVKGMYNFLSDRAIGLAANQVGVNLRVFVYELHDGRRHIVNPKISDASGVPQLSFEGCLSHPGKTFIVERFPRIKVVGQDYNGDNVEFVADDLFAALVQHEINHLDGLTPMEVCKEWYGKTKESK